MIHIHHINLPVHQCKKKNLHCIHQIRHVQNCTCQIHKIHYLHFNSATIPNLFHYHCITAVINLLSWKFEIHVTLKHTPSYLLAHIHACTNIFMNTDTRIQILGIHTGTNRSHTHNTHIAACFHNCSIITFALYDLCFPIHNILQMSRRQVTWQWVQHSYPVQVKRQGQPAGGEGGQQDSLAAHTNTQPRLQQLRDGPAPTNTQPRLQQLRDGPAPTNTQPHLQQLRDGPAPTNTQPRLQQLRDGPAPTNTQPRLQQLRDGPAPTNTQPRLQQLRDGPTPTNTQPHLQQLRDGPAPTNTQPCLRQRPQTLSLVYTSAHKHSASFTTAHRWACIHSHTVWAISCPGPASRTKAWENSIWHSRMSAWGNLACMA